MLKIIILLTLSLNFAFAETRFSDADSQKFLKMADETIEQLTKEKAELKDIKENAFEILQGLADSKHITEGELAQIKKEYDDLATRTKPGDAKEVLKGYVKNKFNQINQRPILKSKEGMICNKADCDIDLQCSIDPMQRKNSSCKSMELECNSDSECCSSSCKLNESTKKKTCEAVLRCYRPLALGQSCSKNPVCSIGLCAEYNANTIGIGECSEKGKTCKQNSDCCSNSCTNNKCVTSFVCKNCASNGSKAGKDKSCCEGLYPDENQICIPDLPPVIPPQVHVPSIKKFLISVADFFISSAEAVDAPLTSSISTDIGLQVMRKSSFKTCDIHFRDDFYSYLKNENLLQLEAALLSFDYVMLGEGVEDYWIDRSASPSFPVTGVAGVQEIHDDVIAQISRGGSSINGRLKSVALDHLKKRHETNAKFVTIDKKLTCMCLDVIGYKNIKDDAKKVFFEKECSEYAKYGEGANGLEDLEGDSSGLKGKKLLVYWTSTLAEFNSELAVDNVATNTKLAEISEWVKNDPAKWSSGERKEDFLYTYTIKKFYLLALLFLAVLTGAIGLIVVFAMKSSGGSSVLGSAVALAITSGYPSVWIEDSLKGAWQKSGPYIHDVKTSSKNCGPKFFPWLYKCENHSVYLNHPVNNVCNKNTYANACLKNFMAVYPDPTRTEGTPKYIIDPWVPYGVNKTLLIKDIDSGTASKNYAESLQDSFLIGKRYATNGSKNPKMTAAGLAQFGLRFANPQAFVLTKDIIDEIKKKAKEFAIAEKFFEPTDEENLNKFADYAYEFHFLRPKLSPDNEIGYPLLGLVPYLEYMANGVISKLSAGGVNAANTFGGLNAKYLADYLRNLELYSDQAIHQGDVAKSKLLNKEIATVKSDLDNLTAFNAIANNGALDRQLMGLSAGSNPLKKITGANGNINLNPSQARLLNAIGKLRNARKNQLKKLDAYNKAMEKNGNPERAARIASVSKSYGSNFSNPFSSSSFKGSPSGDSIIPEKTPDEGKYDDSAGAFLESGSASLAPPESNEELEEGNSKSKSADGNNGMSEEDRHRLTEAVEARDKSNKETYVSKEGQSIFEKITNAYIRNYDKVLNKKKDKEAIEKN